MSNTKKRGRPRAFCEEAALDAASALFAARGFDAVTIADLTGAMGIRPPSFYAAFGSKAQLYERVLDRSAAADPFVTETLDGAEDLRSGLRALLSGAAARYAGGTGCLVAEGARTCTDEDARAAACTRLDATRAVIAGFARSQGKGGAAVADLVLVALHGLSAAARAGQGAETLDAFARMTADAIVDAATNAPPRAASASA